jgi:hypothetical protein
MRILYHQPSRPMSESEGKRELLGLARSIDALFASLPALAGLAPAEPVIEEVFPLDVVMEEALVIEADGDVEDEAGAEDSI